MRERNPLAVASPFVGLLFLPGGAYLSWSFDRPARSRDFLRPCAGLPRGGVLFGREGNDSRGEAGRRGGDFSALGESPSLRCNGLPARMAEPGKNFDGEKLSLFQFRGFPPHLISRFDIGKSIPLSESAKRFKRFDFLRHRETSRGVQVHKSKRLESPKRFTSNIPSNSILRGARIPASGRVRFEIQPSKSRPGGTDCDPHREV